MAPCPVKLIASAAGLAFVLVAAAPADAAKARKHKPRAAFQTSAAVRSGASHRGTNLFPAGPVYNGPDYLGDDPDPNIRFQILRDLGAHYGGND